MTNVKVSNAQMDLTVYEKWNTNSGTHHFFKQSVTTTDNQENVYVVGATLNAFGEYDMLIAKYHRTGILLWEDVYSGVGSGDDVATAIYIDGDYDVYVTGTVYTSQADSNDIVTLKYNSNGTLQWSALYNGNDSGNDVGTDITVDNSGNVYVVGGTQTDSSLVDFVAIKYNSIGQEQWTNTWSYQSTSYDAAHKVFYDELKDEVIVHGGMMSLSSGWYAYAVVFFDGGDGSLIYSHDIDVGTVPQITTLQDIVLDNQGNIYITGGILDNTVEMFTIKLDDSLNIIWLETFNSSHGLVDIGNALAVDDSGNVYVAGVVGKPDMTTDYVLVKYNSTGQEQWVEYYNGGGFDTATAIAIHDGGIIVTGSSFNGMNDDYYTIKYSAGGDVLWEIAYNGLYNGNDNPVAIAIDGDNNILVTGSSFNGDYYSYSTVKYIELETLTPADTIPLSRSGGFISNRGQLLNTEQSLVPEIRYYTHSLGTPVYFTDTAMSYVLSSISNDTLSQDTLKRVDVVFKDADETRLFSMNKKSQYRNYYLAHIPEGRTNVPEYKNLYSSGVYRGIDVRQSSNSAGLKTQFIMYPNIGHPRDITLEVKGADNIRIDDVVAGDLIIETSIGVIRWPQPRAWQIDALGDSIWLSWKPEYHIDSNIITFKNWGSYNSNEFLVFSVEGGENNTIEAEGVCWSTYVGGLSTDLSLSMHSDENGIYIVGRTSSKHDFPHVQTVPKKGNLFAFMSRFDNNHELTYSTLFGGDDINVAKDIYVNNGEAYIVGLTTADDFPTRDKIGAYYDDVFDGASKSFIFKIGTNTGTRLWATYFGGDGLDYASGISFNSNNEFYMIGLTNSSDIPLTSMQGTYTQSHTGTNDLFIAQFNSLDDLIWSTYLGGNGFDRPKSIVIDNNDRVIVNGNTSSTNLPVKNYGSNAFYENSLNGSFDDFLFVFNNQNQKVWGTYIGGSSNEEHFQIPLIENNGYNNLGIKSNNNIIIAGSTNSSDFPLEEKGGNAYYNDQFDGSNGFDGYIMEFDGLDFSLNWSTFLTGSGNTLVYSVNIDNQDNINIGGSTGNSDFPIVHHSVLYIQDYLNAGTADSHTKDAFITRFSNDNEIVWSTFFGGSSGGLFGDRVLDIVQNGNLLYITGVTTSSSNVALGNLLPLKDYGGDSFFLDDFQGGSDAFIAMFCLNDLYNSINSVKVIDETFLLFPNPAHTEINILIFNNLNNGFTYRIYDASGRLIKQNRIDQISNTFKIDISKMLPGKYIIQILNSNSKWENKFIVY